MRIVLSQIVFDWFHHLYEVFKWNHFRVRILNAFLLIFHSLRSNLPKEILCLFGISLQALHNSFEVFNIDSSNLLLIKKIKYFFEVINFFVGKLHRLYLLVFIWHRLIPCHLLLFVWIHIFLHFQHLLALLYKLILFLFLQLSVHFSKFALIFDYFLIF